MLKPLKIDRFWLLFSLFLSLNFLQAADSPLKEYRITDSKGPTGVVPANTKEASPAVKGMMLLPGDHLVTGKKGRIELATKEGSILELKEKSSLEVQKIAEHQNIFALKIGKLLARFAPSPDKQKHFYFLRTPSCVAAVRGTELAVDVADNGGVQAGVVEGEVNFDSGQSLDEYEKSPEAEENSAPVQVEISTTPLAAAATEQAKSEELTVATNGGIIVEPGQKPRKIDNIPPVVVGELVWFTSLRERIPQLRDQWKDMDLPSKMKMRQGALRERINWSVPAKYLEALEPPSQRIQPLEKPKGVAPEKLEVPKVK